MSSLQQTDMLYSGSEIRCLLVCQSGKSIISSVTCGLELPTSPPASPTALPPTLSTAEGKCGEVQQSSPTTTRNCLSGVVMIEGDKATAVAMSDQHGVNHSKNHPEERVCEVSS